MAGIATPQEMMVTRDAKHIVLQIQGAGQMRMPPTVAHWLARELVGQANQLEKEQKLIGRWPHLNRR